MSFRQHSIDLLPEGIDARSRAGQRMGRFGSASAVVIIMLVVAATHSRWALHRAQVDLFNTSAQATEILSIEAKARTLQRVLTDSEQFIDMYKKVVMPIDASAVLATVIRNLPESATLDQIDLNAAVRPATRSPRSKADTRNDGPAPRILNGEVSGFAASDQHIAELVSRLSGTPPFKDVSLDFSRTREVRGQSAREFRVSFRIDLETAYRLANAADRSPVAIAQEAADVK